MTGTSFSIERDPDAAYVRIRVRGKMTAPEAREARGRVLLEHPGANRLWDFREADLTAWTIDDMRMFIDVINRKEPDEYNVRVAALVARDIDYGLARMFEQLSAGLMLVKGGVFREEQDAIAFLQRTD